MDVEQRARELLAAEYERYGDMIGAAKAREQMPADGVTIRAIIAALTPPEGHVVVTRDEDGEIVMVSRQNDDHEVLEVIALTTHAGGKPCEYTPPEDDMGNPISVPDGFVLVPVEPTEAMKRAFNGYRPVCRASFSCRYEEMLAARPEVTP